MEAKTNYTLVGLVVLILMASLLSVGLWLSVGFNQKSYIQYTVYLHESAAGLPKDAAVKFNGVQVGYVKKISLNRNDPRQVEIILNIEKGTPITNSTYATLISQGITGVTYVGLSASAADLTPIQKMPDEPYPVIPAKPSLFNQLDSLLKEVAEGVSRVSDEAQKIFNTENALYIKHSLANMEQISKVIADNSSNINQSLHNTDIFFSNMAKVSKDFPQILKELKVGVTRFNVLATDLSHAGKNVSKTMVSGKNALDKISIQALPSTVTLIHRLNNISANLEKISNEMRQNPSVIIRGTAPPKSGPGE